MRMLVPTVALLALTAPDLHADDPFVVLLRSTDPVPGSVGEVFGDLSHPAVNDAGSWAVTGKDPSAHVREVVDGAVVLESFDPVGSKVFAGTDQYRTLDSAGRPLWILRVQASSPPRVGVYSLDKELVFEEDPVEVPGFESSTYSAIAGSQPFWLAGPGVNRSAVFFPRTGPNQLIDMAPRVVFDAAGTKLSEELFLSFPFTLPGTSLIAQPPLVSFADVSSNGSYVLATNVGPQGGTALRSIVVNGAVVARNQSPSPFGEPWSTLTGQNVVNNSGAYAFSALVASPAGGVMAITVNGAPSYLGGTTLPAIHPWVLGSLWADLEVHSLNDRGQLLWTGNWNDPDPARGTGLFLDDTLIVSTGVTRIEGSTVVGLDRYPVMSESGDWILLTVELASGVEVLVRYDSRQLPVNYCTAGTAASGCTAGITGLGQPSATLSSGFDLLTAGIADGTPGLFFFGSNGRQASAWGNGTSLQCVVPPVQRLPILTTSSSTSGTCDGGFGVDLNTHWNVVKPAQNPGAGAVVQAQVWYRDPASTSNQTTSLSNALEFTVCP